jgi:T4 RnlA family RNA ligase
MSNNLFFFCVPACKFGNYRGLRNNLMTNSIKSYLSLASFPVRIMASCSTSLTMHTLYDDLINLCSYDDAFYYKDIRLHAINYRIFNYRLCSYGRFKTGTAALNCAGTMFNITNPKNVLLVSLPMEKIFDYEEGFGQTQYHERGRVGDKMEKLDGSLMSTFLHGRTPKDQVLRLKAKQTLTSNQVQDAMRLLTGT